MPADRRAPAALCEGLVRIYWSRSGEVHALKGVDAVVPAGRLTAITGPSGSGKSSLLRILAAQDRPTAGRAEVAGESLSGMSSRRLRAVRRRHIGYVFPRPAQNLAPHLDGREHLAVAARLRGVPRARAAREGAELLDLLGLADRAGHLPGELSGGEQQRLAFAQAVIGGPALVVADEPTGELDSQTTAELLAAVRELTLAGTTVVLATHDPLAAAAADQVVHLRSGTVAHEEVAGQRLAVIDGDGRVQLPEEALRRFSARRVQIDVTADGVVLREPS
ncbi:putative ABC transport system ATP-binding protein [Modestobacter versicolor]|uniref:Putative ABC transport system ATP-binding protein n=3 Tax=Modestobacter versicolor TaxID=429133 RepID=A0A839Y320_9ACTN|nr:ABC transporter ATP-binding protein [Modestobacter versicolor]MBB3675772.1 putative ABC transport system ATP-binding protein [Modestobacter versicolor]